MTTINSTPRILLAGLSGGAGKTIVSLALVRALTDSGHRVKPFKKGPDYIDANWLSLAAGNAATNLDPCFLGREELRALFAEKTVLDKAGRACDLAVIEGNRGLFDGKDVDGSCSTAELARQLETPVVLILDCTKMTRTAAAIVAGCAAFEEGVNLVGVVLNRTAGDRHRAILRSAIETYTDATVLGVLPKLKENPVPERHMGLVSDQEYDRQAAALEELGRIGRENLDLDGLMAVARMAPEFEVPSVDLWPPSQIAPGGEKPVIGYVHDAALWFYYPENLEALERAGAKLVRLSLLDSEPWPEIHGLYLGGGFPETLAERLSENETVRERVRALAEAGMPIYAECGGFMYLCKELEYGGKVHDMAGVFNLATGFCPRPQGLGYTEAVVERENPFYPLGARIRGHEFHYSHCVSPGKIEARPNPDLCLRMERGTGMLRGRDGVVQHNVMASYNHIFALATPEWAPGFVRASLEYAGR